VNATTLCATSYDGCILLLTVSSRMEQIPEGRSMAAVEDEIDSKCCVCLQKWTVYRGQYSCASNLCGVPVIVCNHCMSEADTHPKSLQCDLCRENYRPPETRPDLVEIKRKAEERMNNYGTATGITITHNKKRKLQDDENLQEVEYYPDRLFLSRLPLTVTLTKLKQALLPPEVPLTHKERQMMKVHWMTDPQTNAFYGSAIVQMPNPKVAATIVAKAKSHTNKTVKHGIRIDKKRIKVSYVKKRKESDAKDGTKGTKTSLGAVFSSSNYNSKEYPPILQ